MPSPPELSSDIQRAIQQAVGQVNNAFISHQGINQPRPAKRKRRATAADAQAVKGQKAADTACGSLQESSSVVAADQLKPRSKKSKKAIARQGVEVVPDVGSVNESLVSSSGPPSQSRSSEAFIDAAVSATPVTSATSEPPYDFSHPCFDSPAPSSYPYSTIPDDLPLTPTFQPPISFSDATIPGLEYASNDDVIRALQDLDVTKVASVLKTLGEAAAAANISLTPLSSTMLQRTQTTAPIDSASSNPVVIAESPAQRVLQHHRPLIDINTPHEPLEHSVLLATKWLSANKLAELARTQGQCQCHLWSRDPQLSIRHRIGVQEGEVFGP